MKKTNNTETAQAPAGMPRTMYPDLAPEARADKMRDTADKVMDYQYHKPYTEEEIADRRKTLADLCIRISDLEGELAAQKALYKSLIQPEETAREGPDDQLPPDGEGDEDPEVTGLYADES